MFINMILNGKFNESTSINFLIKVMLFCQINKWDELIQNWSSHCLCIFRNKFWHHCISIKYYSYIWIPITVIKTWVYFLDSMENANPTYWKLWKYDKSSGLIKHQSTNMREYFTEKLVGIFYKMFILMNTNTYTYHS